MKPKVNYKVNIIGSVITVIDSANKTLIGVSGKVVDETKHSIIVDTSEKELTIMKHDVVFRKKNDGMIIDGKKIDTDIVSRLKQK